MRTTVTLDPDVARLVDAAMQRDRRTFKDTINDAIRRGISPTVARPASPFKLKAHKTQLAAGYDPVGFNRLADDIEDWAVVEKGR